MDSNDNKPTTVGTKVGGLRRNGFSFDSLTSVFGTGNQAAAILDFAEQSDQEWNSTGNTAGHGHGHIPSLSSQTSALQGAETSNESVASCASVASLSSKSDVGPSTSARRRWFSGPSNEKASCDMHPVPQQLIDNRQMSSGTDNFNQKYMLNWLYRPTHTFSSGISEEPTNEDSSVTRSEAVNNVSTSAGSSLAEAIKNIDSTAGHSSRRNRIRSEKGAREHNIYAPSNW